MSHELTPKESRRRDDVAVAGPPPQAEAVEAFKRQFDRLNVEGR